MNKRDLIQIFDRRLRPDRQSRSIDQFCGVMSDRVQAEDLSRLRVDENLENHWDWIENAFLVLCDQQ